MSVVLKNVRTGGALGFPGVGGAAFELEPNQAIELSDGHADALLAAPGVPEFLLSGWLVVERPSPAGIVPVPEPAPVVEAPVVDPAESVVDEAASPTDESAPPAAPGRRRRGG